MLTSHELDAFGKSVAEDFTTNKISLTDGLTKVAQERGLNGQQISRVAESANIETYLTIMKTASDPYIQYDLADPIKVRESIHGVEKTASHAEDYNTPLKSFNTEHGTTEEDFEKVASATLTTTLSESELVKEAQRVFDTGKFIIEEHANTAVQHEAPYLKLRDMAKQAILSGSTFEDVSSIWKEAAPKTAEYLTPAIREYLEPRLPLVSFDAEAVKTASRVNPDSDIFKTAQVIEGLGDRIEKLEQASDLYFEKLANYFYEAETAKYAGAPKRIGGWLKDLFNFGRKHKALAAMPAVTAVAFRAGKNKGRFDQEQVLDVAAQKLGPKRTQVFR